MLKKLYTTIAVCTLLFALTLSIAYAKKAQKNLFADLNLSEEQIAGLNNIFEEYRNEELKILVETQTQSAVLKSELRKADRFKTQAKEKASVQKANQMVRELGKLQGKLLKTRTSYLLKVKDVLTKEQRKQLISFMIDLEIDVGDESFLYSYAEFDLLEFDLDLSIDQIKKILKYRTDMQIEELRIKLKTAHKVLDLTTEIVQTESSTENINNQVMEISNFYTQIIDNRVGHFIKAKDVLTTVQKKKLLNVLLITP